MPSINELREFKASLNNIGNQITNLAAKNIPFDDLELPLSEPSELPETSAPAAEPIKTTTSLPAEPIEDPAADDIDFSAFLGAEPGELSSLLSADIGKEEEQSTEDLYAPEGLLSNLSEELDAIPPDFPELTRGRELDLDSLDNFDFPEEPLSSSKEDAVSDEEASSTEDGLDSGISEDFELPAE
jgi:hypothetical protein